MAVVIEVFRSFWANIVTTVLTFKPQDVLDILVVAYIIHSFIRLVKETRAMQLLKGIAAIFVLYFLAQILNMITLSFLIRNVLSWGIIVVAVVFQPELRRALEQMGRTKFSSWGRSGESSENTQREIADMVEVVCDASEQLASQKTGALIVFERQTMLGDIIKTGTRLDAKTSFELVCNIFFPNSPLHDGAVIMRGGKLLAAGCFLPLSDNMQIARELGTRHRAALGMSEVSDAVVLIVSEETGAISVAVNGKLQRGLSDKNLRKLLGAKLLPPDPDAGQKNKRKAFWRSK